MPRVSVLMVFHQVTPHLEPAVRSVLGQSWRDLELVLVDNGTGTGLAPLGDWGGDSRIRLVSLSENRGIPAAHNLAVAEARGEYLALLDYDDRALPTRLERLVAFLDANRDQAMVSSRAETIDAAGRVVGREFSLLNPRDQALFSQFAPPVVTPAYAGRRETFMRFPYRPEFRLCADFDALARMADGLRMAGVPEVLLQYRRYPEQASAAGSGLRRVEECIVRLCTARRRAGRDEDYEALLAEMRPWRERPPAPPLLYAEFSRRFLREGYPLMAVYHARKLLGERRGPSGWTAALKTVGRACRMRPGEAWLFWRLFLTGPVRALGLKPV